MSNLLKQVHLTFTKSGSPDVVGYALYIEEAPNPASFNSQRFDLGNPPDDGSGKIDVLLSELPGIDTKDGVYNLGISAVDDAGNESSLLTDGLDNIALDFVAPDPPTSASVYYS
jgi:hypothetical protein